MRARVRRLRVTCLLLACLSGCSTYEASDVWVTRETGEQHVAIKGPDASLNLQFDDATRFASAGFFGMPVIPMYVKSEPARVLVLHAQFELPHRVEYSLAAGPCLTTRAGPLCPESVHIRPGLRMANESALDTDGHATEMQIPGLPDFDFKPAANAQLTSKEMEQGISYVGSPPWTSARFSVVYLYRCATECPTEFEMVTDYFASAGETFRPKGSLHFVKKRVNDYRGLTAVQ